MRYVGGIKMKYIGIDIHKEFCVVAEMDKEGNVLRQDKIDTSKEAIREYFSSIGEAKVAIESTGIWEWIYEIIDAVGLEVKLVNPIKARAIAEAKIKTDKVDSTILAHLLRSNLIPEIYVGDREMREIKRIVNERLFLKKQIVQIKNRIHSELLRRGIKKNIFTKNGRKYLRELKINSIDRELNILESIEKEMESINEELRQYCENDEDAKILTTIPGIGYYTAVALVAVIGDINRFSSSEKLSSYFGSLYKTIWKQSISWKYNERRTR